MDSIKSNPDAKLAMMTSCYNQFKTSQNFTMLEKALALGDSMLQSGELSLDPPRGIRGLHLHGYFLLCSFIVSKSYEDLDKAVLHLDSAVKGAPEAYSDMVSLLESLHRAHHYRYRRYGGTASLQDLHAAVAIGQRAISAIAGGYESSERLQSNVGNAFHDLYEETNKIGDLNEAIRFARAAVHSTSASDVQLPHRHQCLGTGLYARFNRQGNLRDLREALHFWKLALDRTSGSDPKRGRRLDDLGAGLCTLYESTDQLEDIEASIRYLESAVGDEADGHEELPERQGNLALSIYQRYKRTQDKNELQSAIGKIMPVVETLQEDHSRRAGLLDQAAVMLYERHVSSDKDNNNNSDFSDLERAISLWTTAVGLTPEGNWKRGERCNNLGNGFNARHHYTGNGDDLQKAIHYWDAAVQATPHTDPTRSTRMKNQGIGYHNLFKMTHEPAHQKQARCIFEQALQNPIGSTLERIAAGRRAASIARDVQDWKGAAEIYAQCVELLPAIAIPTKSQSDLGHVLRQLANLGAESAYAFLMAGRSAFESLQMLESCRGVIASLTIDLRSDLSQLEALHPTIAAKYRQLRESLSSTTFSLTKDVVVENGKTYDFGDMAMKRLQDAEQLSVVLKEIRSLPGFTRFQLTPTKEELLLIARDGPIVCFNVTSSGSHAFLVTTMDVEPLRLPNLRLQDVDKSYKSILSDDNQTRRMIKFPDRLKKSNNESYTTLLDTADLGASAMDKTMHWLWDVAVGPVLAKLGLLSRDEALQDLPCVWWVGAGPMANLPLHAAGNHSLGAKDNTISNVVSTYATSFKTLQFSQTKARERSPDTEYLILIVAMPETPGEARLNIHEEMNSIKRHFGDSVKLLTNPSSVEVIEELKRCSLVHFACHANADPDDPLRSYFHLGKTTPDRLTLRELQPLSHELADVAFLSACSTAVVSTDSLMDESIHLASTFQLAGFRNVIGTLWGAYDTAAASVSSAFYQHLLEQRTRSVGRALHHAIVSHKSILDREKPDLSMHGKIKRWAPFVHRGR